MNRLLVSVSVITLCFLLSMQSAFAEVTVEKSENGAVVKIDGQLFTEYLVRSANKPILYPIIGPTGKAMTRHYPMAPEKGKGEKGDHPHHRSMWFTHGEVNGVSYWHQGDETGTIAHKEFVTMESAGSTAVIASRNDWIGPDGKKVCEDLRTITFRGDDQRRWIDFDVTVTASEGPVTFGDTKEGSFGVRVPGTMKVDSKPGGNIVNSEGQTDRDTWGKQAAWVDYHGPVDGEHLGIAILNHPSSFRYPSYWHVRTYGLFAANPFGLHHFIKAKKGDGALRMEKGDTFTLRYRVLFHKGDEKEGGVADAFAEYSKLDKS